jgi:hypothetical protein
MRINCLDHLNGLEKVAAINKYVKAESSGPDLGNSGQIGPENRWGNLLTEQTRQGFQRQTITIDIVEKENVNDRDMTMI